MVPLLDVIGLLAIATLFGSMTFFSFVMAPLIFIKLDGATAGRFVRGVFPWYYLVVAGLSVLAAIALAAGRPVEAGVTGLIALGAILARQVLMPRINRYRDGMLSGDRSAERPFTWLHRMSVWVNGAQLIGALFVLVRLALP